MSDILIPTERFEELIRKETVHDIMRAEIIDQLEKGKYVDPDNVKLFQLQGISLKAAEEE